METKIIDFEQKRLEAEKRKSEAQQKNSEGLPGSSEAAPKSSEATLKINEAALKNSEAVPKNSKAELKKLEEEIRKSEEEELKEEEKKKAARAMKKRERRKRRRKVRRGILGFLLALILAGAVYSFFPFKMNEPESAEYNRALLTAKIVYRSLYGTVQFPEGTCYIDGAVPIVFSRGLKIRGTNGGMTVNDTDNAAMDTGTILLNTGYTHDNDASEEAAGIWERLKSGFFVLFASKNVTISDVTLDYMSYMSVVGTIAEKGFGSVTLQLDEKTDGSGRHRAITGHEVVMAVNEYNADGRIFTDQYLTNVKTTYDPKAENGQYTINGVDVRHSEIGDEMVVRFTQDRSMPPIFLYNASGTVIENVRVLSSPHMLITANFGDSLTVRGLHVESDCKEEQRWGSSCDGLHLSNMTGHITLEDSTFIGMGDDPFNYNSLALLGRVQVDGTLLISDPNSMEPIPAMYVKKGDVLRLYSRGSEPLGELKAETVRKGVATIKAFKPVDESATWIEGEEAVHAFLKNLPEKGFYIANTRFLPSVEIRRNTVSDCRARAFLIRSTDVEVSDNDISNLALAGILVSYDLDYWHEMAPSRNVRIENNTFTNCCTEIATANFGVIAIKGGDDSSGGAIGWPVHENISVLNNTFKDCGAPAVFATGVKGFTYKGNVVTGQKNPTGSKSGDEELVIGKCVE